VGSEVVHAGKMMVSGNTWTFPWEITNNGKTVHFRVVNTFTAPDEIRYAKEYSEEGQHWIAMESGREIKVP
jgi:hypothetical protein